MNEDDVPVCPACGAVGREVCDPVLGHVLETVHSDSCAWMHDPESEPYA